MVNEVLITPTPSVPSPAEYARLDLRFLAVILDGLIFLVLFWGLENLLRINPETSFPIADSLLDFPGGIEATSLGPRILKSLFFLIDLTCYKILLVGKFGATLGKMALGLKVVNEDKTSVSYGTALVREFLVKNLIYGVLFFIAWLGFLWAFWDKKRQTWHDKIARTVVVKM